jgi:MFS family permease
LQRNALVGVDWGNLLTDPEAADALTGDGGTTAALWIGLLVGSLTTPFVAGALSAAVVAWRSGREITAGAALGAAARCWWVLLVAWFLDHAAQLLAGCTVVGTVGVVVLFVVAAPVAVTERVGPIACLRRSVRLVTRRFGAALGVVLLTALVAGVLGQSLAIVPTFLAGLVGFDLGWPLLAAGQVAAALITTPFVAGATVMLYWDLRVRSEGLDLAERAERILGEAQ